MFLPCIEFPQRPKIFLIKVEKKNRVLYSQEVLSIFFISTIKTLHLIITCIWNITFVLMFKKSTSIVCTSSRSCPYFLWYLLKLNKNPTLHKNMCISFEVFKHMDPDQYFCGVDISEYNAHAESLATLTNTQNENNIYICSLPLWISDNIPSHYSIKYVKECMNIA